MSLRSAVADGIGRRKRPFARTGAWQSPDLRAVAALVLGAAAACLVVSDEWRIANLATAAQAARTPLPTPEERSDVAEELSGCAGIRNDRAHHTCAIAYVALAQQASTEDEQAWFLSQAVASDRLLQERAPKLGEARIAHALVHASDGSEARAAQALAESYALQPYSPDSALWRIDWAADRWDLLPEEVRLAVQREAIWYAARGKEQRDAVLAAIAGTPPFVAVALRLPSRILFTRQLSQERE